MNGYPSFYPRIALVAPSPEGSFSRRERDNSAFIYQDYFENHLLKITFKSLRSQWINGFIVMEYTYMVMKRLEDILEIWGVTFGPVLTIIQILCSFYAFLQEAVEVYLVEIPCSVGNILCTCIKKWWMNFSCIMMHADHISQSNILFLNKCLMPTYENIIYKLLMHHDSYISCYNPISQSEINIICICNYEKRMIYKFTLYHDSYRSFYKPICCSDILCTHMQNCLWISHVSSSFCGLLWGEVY